MPVICNCCQRSFDKQITNSHLRSHNMTTEEYKNKYGNDSLASDEYRAEKKSKSSGKNNPMYGKKHSDETKDFISKTNLGREAHNKGVSMSDEQKEKLRIKAVERNKKWTEEGNHPMVGRKLSDDTKNKLREKRKLQQNSVENNPEIVKKIQESRKKYTKDRLIKTNILVKQKVEEWGYTLVSDETDHLLQIYSFKCNKCGNNFERTRESILKENMCHVCNPVYNSHSKIELNILKYIRELLPDEVVLCGNRNKIYPLELDIFIPSKNVAIEICGLYWHSELMGKGMKYHVEKLEKCISSGIRLITIFEDEIYDSLDIVKKRLSHILGKSLEKRIYARNCVIKEINDITEVKNFINKNHLQGYTSSQIKLGLYEKDELVSVMTFAKPSIAKGGKTKNGWELSRFCSSENVIGGASKLLQYFIRNYSPTEIFSFSDRRWSIGNVYEKIGFVFEYNTSPNYWYIKGAKRIHRFSLRKNSNDDQSLTEWENRQNQGWNRIWDCGHGKWVWKK